MSYDGYENYKFCNITSNINQITILHPHACVCVCVLLINPDVQPSRSRDNAILIILIGNRNIIWY